MVLDVRSCVSAVGVHGIFGPCVRVRAARACVCVSVSVTSLVAQARIEACLVEPYIIIRHLPVN